jgi:phage tail-like protein
MPLSPGAMLGLAMRFQVVVDGVDLGGWQSCKGLSVDFKPEPIAEGGNYEYSTYLPGRLTYTEVTLMRAMTAADSGKVQQWLSSKISGWVTDTGLSSGGTMRITLQDAHGGQVSSWSLRNVQPKAWKGPDLESTASKVALETLVLVHEGFL